MKSFTIPILGLFSFASQVTAQHDAQRNAVRHIASEDFDAVAKEYKKPKVDAGPAETLFVEMLLDLAQNDTDSALEKAKRAVAAGLPFERLLAGPRQLLDRLHEHSEFAKWKEEVAPPLLIHGPMLGSVTHEGASFWIRTAEASDFTVSVQTDGGEPIEVDARTTAADSFTGKAQVSGLMPDSEYVYRIAVGKESDPASGTFRTRPAPGEATKFSVAFGGGAGFVPEWERMWDTIGSHDPSAVLMLGDNVYIDDPTRLLTHHYCYSRRQSRPEWRKLIAGTPMYSIYDDHDFGMNDCIPGPGIESPPWKRQVWETFKENWVNPAYGGGESNPGCWYDFSIGDVQFFLLDGRYYRDLKGGSMLGPVQKKWLLDGLSQSEATFKVIASPVPFTPKIKPGSKDPWDGYPEEREEIFSHIEKEGIDGVFLVAADRHRTDLRKIGRPEGRGFYEFESSRLTNHHTHEVVETEGLIWGYSEKCSFGLMEFDTTAEMPRVVFRCIDIDGVEHHSHTLTRMDTLR